MTQARAALKTADRTVSFAEFDARANQSARYLLQHGAEADKLIGYCGKNSLDFYFALFGCARTRGGMVVLNWRLAAPELAAQIEDSEARFVIVEREMEPLWTAATALMASPPEALWIDEQTTYESIIASQSDDAGRTLRSAKMTPRSSFTPAAPPASPKV